MARIPDGRKRKHQSISVSADMETTVISEGKGSRGQNGYLVHKTLGTTEQFSATGNSDKEQNLSQDIAEHPTIIQQNEVGFKQKCKHYVPQRLKQIKKQGKNGIATKKKVSGSVSTSNLDIEQDPAGSQQLNKLRMTVERLGGKLEDGWHVNSQRRSNNGLPFFIFISPTKERFRSRIDVVRHLGLPARPAKSRLLSSNQLALVPYNRRNKSLLKSSKARRSSGKLYLKIGKGHECAGKHVLRPTIVQSKEANDIQKTSTLNLSASDITQRCQDILRSIISTESFAALSNIVSRGASSPSMEATLRLKGSSCPACPLDLKLIHLRLSTGAYGRAPEMFSADIQQVWKNIITAGNELVTLASSLAELSESLYKQQITSLHDGFPKKIVNASNISNQQSFDDPYLHMTLPERITARAADDTFSKELPEIFVEDLGGVKISPLEPKVAHSRLLKQLLSKTPSHELSKKVHKRAGEAKELLAPQGRLSCSSIDSICRKCGLNQDAECIVCNGCKAGYHPNCVVVTLTGGGWCCPLCLLNQATEKAWGTDGKGIVDEAAQEELLLMNSNATTEICHGFEVSSAKLGICEVCKKEDDNVLLCDACDAAYHMHCLNPSIDSVPDGSWYCPACDEAGKNSIVFQQDTNVHNCAVCDRVSRELLNYAVNESTAQVVSKDTSALYLAPEHTVDHGYADHSLNRGLSENCLENRVIEPDFVAGNSIVCKVCGQGEGKKSILCSNCQNCYHLSCLKPALRRRPCKTWYCPSCLCRVCQIDADDDKILLCDACDEGYHTYCLTPPLPEVPEEAWFCHSCTETKAYSFEGPKKK